MTSPVSAGSNLIQEIIRIIDAPVLVLDAGRTVVLMNPAAEQFSGWTRSEAAGRNLAEVLGLPESCAQQLVPDRSPPDAAEDELWYEVVCRLKSGETRTARFRRTPVELGDGSTGQLLLLEDPGSWEQRYRDLLSSAPVIFFEAALDGRLLYGANQLAAGLDLDPAVVAGQRFEERVAPGQVAALRELWQKTTAGAATRGREFQLLNGRGQEQPFWISFFPVSGARGVVAVRGIANDLAAQKGLVVALESAEERFSVLFRESSDPILILNMSGEFLLGNPAFERLTSLRSEELFRGDKNASHFVHEEDYARFQESIRRCAEQGRGEVVEYRIKMPGGQTVWFEQSHTILHDEAGQAKGILAVARDVDRRKQQEIKLRETAEVMQQRHQRAQALISKLKGFFTRIGTLPTDIEGFVNGVCEILNDMYRPLRVAVFVIGKQERLFEAGTPAPGPPGHAHLSVMSQTVLESGLPLYCNNLHETEPYLRDPLVQAARLRTYLGAPLRDSTGRIRGTLSLVDAESRAFDSLDVELITVAGLHVAARLRAEEQEEAKRELEDHLRQVQKMEAVGMLAGGIAHDFNNILSGILGFASFLLAKVDKNSDIYGNLQLIEQSAVRASELTRQLLAFARRKHFAKEPVNLNDVIKGVLSILQRSLAKNIVIRPELAEDLPTMLGDAGQLNQVVMNLCLNAADAMAERGGTLRIKTAHRLLTSRERSVLLDAGAGEYVCVTVSDTGKGMNPDVQAHIFDPFFTTKADLGGTGLGLSIVYGIVTNHDGDITVESAEDKGSVFKLYFPVHRGDVRKEESPTALKLRGTETILVVDDEMIVRQMVTAVLKDYGYKVVAVSSGAEAVTMIEELRGRIHLVLLDIVMPGMDGEATYVAIRQIDREVPVLLSSGFAQEERSARLIADGAKGIIHKPYKSEALLSQIREILDSHVWSST